MQAIKAHAMQDQLSATVSTSTAAAMAVVNLNPQHLWRANEIAVAEAESTLPSGFAALDAVLPGGGWPQGQLVELLVDAPGLGELSLLAPALAERSASRPVVWVLPCDQDKKGAGSPVATTALPYAPALNDAGMDLARAIFVQPATARESCWAFEQALRAAHLGAVVGWLSVGGSAGRSSEGEFRALRRLHLLATQSRALVFVLRSTRSAALPSPAALRLQLSQHEGRLQVQVLKRRGRPLLTPVQLTLHPEHWRSTRVAPPAAAEPVEVPAETAQATVQTAQAEQRARRWSMKALFTH
jgi:cell division inhibitor SulA/protein ImuA